MKLFKYLLIASAFCATALAGDSTQVLKRIDQMEGSYSPINAVKIGLFEESTKGYATYADAAGPTPVNGTGGSPVETFTRSTSSPLEGKASGLLTKDAANRQGEGVSYDFTLDAADSTNNPQNMVIDFYYETGGTFTTGVNSDVQIFVYDITNANLITPQVSYIPTPAGRLQTTFLPSSTSTSYRLIFHTATTSASAWTLKLDRVSIHPLSTTMAVSGAATTALLTTGNGFGSTNTNVRRYSSVTVSGSGLICADDATNGASCTVQEDGVWAVNRLDKNTGAASNFGVSKNDACTSGFNSVASGDQLAATQAPSNVAVNAPNVGISLTVGDVIRACDDSGNKTNDTTSQYSRLQIAKVRDAALPSAYIVANCGGAAVTTVGNYKVCTYTATGSDTFQILSGSGTVESLVVGGGGGGGGGNYGGGGGAGGVIHTTPGSVYSVGAYSVSVGAGGAGGGTGGSGAAGTGSAFDAIAASGGGTGGYGNNPSSANGGNGGSGGGGGGGNSPGSNTTGGTGIAGQGFAGSGGNVNSTGVGGGGGGCSAAASASATNVAGSGGNGCSYSISGSSVTYGGGGGGGSNGFTSGTGGTGGGGNGNSSGNGANATGFGSGGGGAGGPTTFSGGAGSNGVVILRYQFQ